MRLMALALLVAALTCECIGASADEYYTLSEIREQSAAGWHDTYTDKYGRTRTVDIDIDVFGKETAPVIKACWGNPLEFRFWSGDKDKEEGPLHEMIAEENNRKGVRIYLYEDVSGMKVDLDEKYAKAYGSDLTLREVYDFLNNRLQEQGIEQDYLWEQPYSFSLLYCLHKKTGEMLVSPTYSLRLWPVEFGLPILSHVGWSFRRNIDGPFENPVLYFDMSNEDSYYCMGRDFDVQEVLAKDIPLCSVKKAIEGARKMIEDGYIYQVLSLRFGYVVYTDPDYEWNKRDTVWDIPTRYLVPSWVMECYILDDPKSNKLREIPNTWEMTINAQTGEMMDWFDTSLHGRGDGRYKGFLSWEEIK